VNRQFKSTPVEQDASLMPFYWRKSFTLQVTMEVIDIFSIGNVLQGKNICFECLIYSLFAN
jgi:hypothetical protein